MSTREDITPNGELLVQAQRQEQIEIQAQEQVQAQAQADMQQMTAVAQEELDFQTQIERMGFVQPMEDIATAQADPQVAEVTAPKELSEKEQKRLVKEENARAQAEAKRIRQEEQARQKAEAQRLRQEEKERLKREKLDRKADAYFAKEEEKIRKEQLKYEQRKAKELEEERLAEEQKIRDQEARGQESAKHVAEYQAYKKKKAAQLSEARTYIEKIAQQLKDKPDPSNRLTDYNSQKTKGGFPKSLDLAMRMTLEQDDPAQVARLMDQIHTCRQMAVDYEQYVQDFRFRTENVPEYIESTLRKPLTEAMVEALRLDVQAFQEQNLEGKLRQQTRPLISRAYDGLSKEKRIQMMSVDFASNGFLEELEAHIQEKTAQGMTEDGARTDYFNQMYREKFGVEPGV